MKSGFNGTNWFEASTDLTDSYIVGSAPPSGFTLRFRGDKAETFEVLMNEVNALIAFKEKCDYADVELNVIYTAGLDDFTPVQHETAVSQLLSAGVKVIAVQADNEYYNKEKANFNFEYYKSKFLPVRDFIYNLDSSIPFVIFLAPRPSSTAIKGSRNIHRKWNDEVKEYLATASEKDSVCIHIYPDGREIPTVKTTPAKRVVDETLDEELDTYYTNLAEEAFVDNHFDVILEYLNADFPDKPIYVTEFGIGSPGKLKNTIGYSQAIFKYWLKYRTKFYCLLEHNGVSLSLAGAMSPATKKDDLSKLHTHSPFADLSTLPRLSLFTFALVSAIPDVIYNQFLEELPETITLDIQENKSVDYYFPFTNTSRYLRINTFTIAKDVNIDDIYIETVYGTTQYSSSGNAPFMSGGSPKSFEISSTEILVPTVIPNIDGTQSIVCSIPEHSLGYLHLSLSKVQEKEPSRPWWCKYFSWANKRKCSKK